MKEFEANGRAKALNRELGAAHEPNDYYVPVQDADGEWQVERRSGEPIKTSRTERAFDWILEVIMSVVDTFDGISRGDEGGLARIVQRITLVILIVIAVILVLGYLLG
ncbi:MAG: hypothetical protein LC749_22700 [Actinobacteria bacterium]|nr:hypothetical protein [Actinomycetota bacterium]